MIRNLLPLKKKQLIIVIRGGKHNGNCLPKIT